jgi:3-deoxy-7-phosphoheptulonate synthase
MHFQNFLGASLEYCLQGCRKAAFNLPGLIHAIQREGKVVLPVSDPVHGNTYKSNVSEVSIALTLSFTTRSVNSLMPTTRRIVTLGVQVKMTGEEMTEYTKGLSGLSEDTCPTSPLLYFIRSLTHWRSSSGVDLLDCRTIEVEDGTGLPSLDHFV